MKQATSGSMLITLVHNVFWAGLWSRSRSRSPGVGRVLLESESESESVGFLESESESEKNISWSRSRSRLVIEESESESESVFFPGVGVGVGVGKNITDSTALVNGRLVNERFYCSIIKMQNQKAKIAIYYKWCHKLYLGNTNKLNSHLAEKNGVVMARYWIFLSMDSIGYYF